MVMQFLEFIEDFNHAYDAVFKNARLRSGEFWGTACGFITLVALPLATLIMLFGWMT